ncbi:MAG: ABC transporter permease [Deltaproteobacteria bacterium]|nr:ABC transporter permease [Deltaproteobacteria bacterium]
MLMNSLLLAVRAIRRNALRSFLTILGVVIGVSAVVVMVTLGDGATQSVRDQISSLGSNLLVVRPGQRLGPGRDSAGAPSFAVADAEAIGSQVGSVAAVAPTAGSSVTVVYQAENWSTNVTGTTGVWFSVGNWTLASGRVFNDAEERAGRAVCVIGETVRKELFGKANPVGSEVRVKRFACEVIGLLKAKGQGAFGMDSDDVVVMPLRTVQRRVRGNEDVTTLLVSVKASASLATAAEAIKALMRERRSIAGNEDDNFNVIDTKQITETLSGTIKVMTMLLGAVAAISLLVGGIGIMNIMLVSVTERTREIGIRLAIGAVENEVLLQFLIEAVVLSSFGGLVGILGANAVSVVAAKLIQVPFLPNLWINLLSFVFSALIGVVFGYFPARRAALLDPIEALRYE